MLQTLNKDPTFDRNSLISNNSSQIKLIKRSSRSKSLRIKRSQSPSSLEQSFPTYFIKKVPKLISKHNEQQLQTTDVTPVKVIQRKSQHELITEKKRQPTPAKSYKDLCETYKTLKKTEFSINIEKQMQINDLEKKLHCQSKIRLMYQQRAKQFQNQVANQAKKVKFIQKQLQFMKQKEIHLNIKITQLETQLQLRNNQIKNTKSSLQKIKQNIIEARQQQYQTQIKKINQQLEKHKQTNQQCMSQINSLKNQNTSLKMEITHIKNISELNRLKVQQQSRTFLLKREIQSLQIQLAISSTEKQRFLEQRVIDLQKEIESLKRVNQSKTIEIDFLARKKHEQLQTLKKRKGQQLKALRIKFASLMDQYKYLKDQKLKGRSREQKDFKNKSVDKRSVEKRQNRFACPTNPGKDRMDDDFLCFSLSPDFK